MIGQPAAVRVYPYTAPCDMRRGSDGLKALAECAVGVNPVGGDPFVYCSRQLGKPFRLDPADRETLMGFREKMAQWGCAKRER